MTSPERLLGTHSVREALRAQRRTLSRLLIARGRDPRRPVIEELRSLATSAGVPIAEVEAVELGARGENPQGVALEVGPLPEVSLEQLVTGAQPRLLLAPDGVEDPQNLGALARVAEAAGVSGLILGRRRSPPLSPALARASAGAIEWLPVARVANVPRALDSLKQRGFWVIGGDVDASASLYDAPDRVFQGDLVVAVGAEGRGLRPAVRQRVDHPLRIPMGGRVASLNVATAGALLLFEVGRRTGQKEPA